MRSGLGDLYTYWIDLSSINFGCNRLEMNGRQFANFLRCARLQDKSQIWVSDGDERLLATISIPNGKPPILNLHWGTVQPVVVNGRR